MHDDNTKTFQVLDKGFIRVVDTMGSDAAIVQAARVSYGKGTKTSRQDEGLIRYLYRNKHTSPFEMCEIKIHVKMPIFVARQWIRHRTASVNEYSMRYSEAIEDFYVPSPEVISGQHEKNKQSRSSTSLKLSAALDVQNTIRQCSEQCLVKYKNLIATGCARELARIVLPTNVYTEMYWKIDLSNYLRFCSLRSHDSAQWEIRQYASVMQDQILKLWCPIVHKVVTEEINENNSDFACSRCSPYECSCK